MTGITLSVGEKCLRRCFTYRLRAIPKRPPVVDRSRGFCPSYSRVVHKTHLTYYYSLWLRMGQNTSRRQSNASLLLDFHKAVTLQTTLCTDFIAPDPSSYQSVGAWRTTVGGDRRDALLCLVMRGPVQQKASALMRASSDRCRLRKGYKGTRFKSTSTYRRFYSRTCFHFINLLNISAWPNPGLIRGRFSPDYEGFRLSSSENDYRTFTLHIYIITNFTSPFGGNVGLIRFYKYDTSCPV